MVDALEDNLENHLKAKIWESSSVLLSIPLEDYQKHIIKFEKNESGEMSEELMSMLIYASRLVYRDNKNKPYFKKIYDQDNASIQNWQDGIRINSKAVFFAVESLTWWGDIISSLSSVCDSSEDTKSFNSLIINQLERGPTAINRKNVNRSYVDREVTRLEEILHKGQKCFKKHKNGDVISCKKCSYEEDLLLKGKDINKIKDIEERENNLLNEIYKAVSKVPYKIPNKNTKIRTPLYRSPELVKIVIKACALSFPHLSYDVLVKIFRKILRKYENFEPTNIDDENKTRDKNIEKQFEKIHMNDINFNKIILELDEKEFPVIHRILVQKEPFSSDKDAADFLGVSVRTLLTRKQSFQEKLIEIIKEKQQDDSEAWDEAIVEEFVQTLKRETIARFETEKMVIN